MMLIHNSEGDVQVTFRVKKHLLDAFDEAAEQAQLSRAALLRTCMIEKVKGNRHDI